MLQSTINLQILSENDTAITTKKYKLSIILSESNDRNMWPFSRQKISSSCIVSSHPIHGPPSNSSYGFVHLMLHIHLGIWDYLLTSHPRHMQCYHHWCSQLQAEFYFGSQGWFPISKPCMHCFFPNYLLCPLVKWQVNSSPHVGVLQVFAFWTGMLEVSFLYLFHILPLQMCTAKVPVLQAGFLNHSVLKADFSRCITWSSENWTATKVVSQEHVM